MIWRAFLFAKCRVEYSFFWLPKQVRPAQSQEVYLPELVLQTLSLVPLIVASLRVTVAPSAMEIL